MIKDKKLDYNYNLDPRAKNKFSDNEILENLNLKSYLNFLLKKNIQNG